MAAIVSIDRRPGSSTIPIHAITLSRVRSCRQTRGYITCRTAEGKTASQDPAQR